MHFPSNPVCACRGRRRGLIKLRFLSLTLFFSLAEPPMSHEEIQVFRLELLITRAEKGNAWPLEAFVDMACGKKGLLQRNATT